MPLQDYMKLVSVDDHLIEHPRVWLDRLPKADHDQAPRIIETDEGAQVWTYQGTIYPSIGLNAVAGKDPREWGWDPVRFDQMMPGCFNSAERLKDMDLDGVHTGMAFPSFPRFAGTLFLEGDDRDLALRCVQAYNDFHIDEWSAADPDRLPPVVILPVWDVHLCVDELRRTVAKGAKGVSFIESPTPLDLPSFHTNYWDPLFSAAEEADIPLMMHFGTSGTRPFTAPDAPEATFIALMGLNSMQAMINLCFSPVFHRHPNLKIVLAEGGIGWMPWMLERADTTWERQRFWQDINQEVRPSELFRRNIWGCFITDKTGIGLRHDIGIDRILWECDFPHSDSMWPNSRKVLAEAVREVPDEEVHAIVELNARELFHLKPA
ncbi:MULTISPECIES: amidohydrolase family protein [Mycolicibacter]|uniref:Amidohydrolase n=1 Tax=Mycolicibacter kumamotonensis TaxID=354243 RepID=A0A7K3L6U0_9MYCO|nr:MULTISPECIES: amidohydrolase family protein [Mycolicibacter]NDJ88139.1 amidohydrolase [Mycolicibacter kumamotonensis]RAV03850.1 amidohydrolase [Mycolicibacter senuensis]